MDLHIEENDKIEEVEIQEEKRTFSIDVQLLEKIEQVAYWERMTNKEVVHEALNQYFQDKKVKPLPAKFQKSRRGRKPA